MEIMEEGNLMDRVRILLQRDLAYYNEHQKVIQENVCSTVVGGSLDFPCIVTFVATKLVTWWEESYYLLFRSLSAIFQDTSLINFETEEEDNISLSKSITSKDFALLISQCAMKLIDHLHILSQEALDHADLSVLTGTIGAAALVRNTIWVYNQQLVKTNSGPLLSKELKVFEDMAEALAERLLDLHNRLIALYILQDVDCLNWTDEHPFFEGERSSYTIQMWWLYIQGTQDDLWNTMPPKTAERIFSGILNESLTILTSRYMQIKAGYARGPLVTADISNILLCIFQVLPNISENADELLGCIVTSNAIRDIHVKCHLLLSYFILRGTPLSVLYKNFKHGFTTAPCLSKKPPNTVEPWIIFAASGRNEDIPDGLQICSMLPANLAIKYELLVLLSRAQPIWPLLLKITRMNDCWIVYEILYHVIIELDDKETEINTEQCNGFLCRDDCATFNSIQNAVVYILLALGNKIFIQKTLIKVLEEVPDKWAIYFSHSQIWNQNRPQWIQTILSMIEPTIKFVIKFVSQNKHPKSPADEIITEYIENLTSTVDCLPEGVIITATLIENILPPDILPAGDSVLIQLMMTALYDELGNESRISEALCRTEAKKFQNLQKSIGEISNNMISNLSYIENDCVNEIIVKHMLKEKLGRASLKVLYNYLKIHADWLKVKLGITASASIKKTLLYKMFYIADNEYDQVLSGAWTPRWTPLLNLPLGLTTENIQEQLSIRPEFWQDIKLSNHDKMVVAHLKSLFVPVIKYAV